MTGHLLSAVGGETWTTGALCVLGVFCACVIVGCALGLPFLRLVKEPVMRTWRRMTPFARIAFVPVVALLANFAASKQGTNAPPQMMAHPGASAPQLAMPANAVRAENWWRRGAWEDVRRVEFT